MSVVKDLSRDGTRSSLEEYEMGETKSTSPKPRRIANEEGAEKFSFFKGTSFEPDMQSDLSTRHLESEEKEEWIKRLGWWNETRFSLTDNVKFVLNCCMWYISSSVTNNIGKSIMNVFVFPVTLTFIQFGLVAFWSLVFSLVFQSKNIRSPTAVIVKTIAPLAVFLIVGHIFSSVAISRIPVSLVHTIKALAPLFTVLFYRLVFDTKYPHSVYISLIPLTIGVILACSFTYSANVIGLCCALGSCFVFVVQNIFSKKLLFQESKLGDRNPNKLDKLNVLLYSSLISFLMMIPLWIYYDSTSITVSPEISGNRLMAYLLLNGTTNFFQNWFAFTTLSLTSPVTYSILSLLKRIFVIVMSILWFGQVISWTQSVGILLTFIGLWMYQKAKTSLEQVNHHNLLPTRQTKLN
ncbi:hypothetical protein HPULCUR_007806 [Helicostylum pulchrum]|uniref:Sugar phosphate transporter domain-containing protein n=1 Tax=Helicostylum pulchrum TaxID=562976 RepID=A0ABP9Y7Q2_9FUNG